MLRPLRSSLNSSETISSLVNNVSVQRPSVLRSTLTADWLCTWRGRGSVWGRCGQSEEGRDSEVTLLPELLMENVPVLIEASVNPLNFPAVTHPQLLTHQPDQALVM